LNLGGVVAVSDRYFTTLLHFAISLQHLLQPVTCHNEDLNFAISLEHLLQPLTCQDEDLVLGDEQFTINMAKLLSTRILLPIFVTHLHSLPKFSNLYRSFLTYIYMLIAPYDLNTSR